MVFRLMTSIKCTNSRAIDHYILYTQLVCGAQDASYIQIIAAWGHDTFKSWPSNEIILLTSCFPPKLYIGSIPKHHKHLRYDRHPFSPHVSMPNAILFPFYRFPATSHDPLPHRLPRFPLHPNPQTRDLPHGFRRSSGNQRRLHRQRHRKLRLHP